MRIRRGGIAAIVAGGLLSTAFAPAASPTIADACDGIHQLTADDLTPGSSSHAKRGSTLSIDSVPTRPGHDTLPARMHEQAQALNVRLVDTQYYCHALEAHYPNVTKALGEVIDYDDYGDSGFYTAQLMAAEALRATVMQAIIDDPATKGWERKGVAAYRDQALDRVRRTLAQLDFNIHISKNWHGDGEPNVYTTTPELDPNYQIADTGGLPIAEAGYPMRNCFPNDAPLRPNEGIRRFVITDDDGVDWLCEAGTSRDAYTGYFFGLMTTFDLLGEDDPQLQATIRDDVLLMVDFAMKYAWGTPRPHGHIALSPDSFDGSYSALFSTSPFSRLWMTASARHVAQVAGTPAEALKWEAIWQEEWASNAAHIRTAWAIDAGQPYGGYYKWNLTHLSIALINAILTDSDTATAEDLDRDRMILDAFGEVDYWTGNDENGFFSTITYGLWGDPQRKANGARLLNDWVDYRHNLETGLNQQLDAARCDLPAEDPQHLDCIREDWTGRVLPDGTEVEMFPGASDFRVLTTPRPVAQRKPETNLWQRWSGDLRGKNASRQTPPGVDYLLPYWLWRYLDEVAPPAARPGPVYPNLLAAS